MYCGKPKCGTPLGVETCTPYGIWFYTNKNARQLFCHHALLHHHRRTPPLERRPFMRSRFLWLTRTYPAATTWKHPFYQRDPRRNLSADNLPPSPMHIGGPAVFKWPTSRRMAGNSPAWQSVLMNSLLSTKSGRKKYLTHHAGLKHWSATFGRPSSTPTQYVELCVRRGLCWNARGRPRFNRSFSSGRPLRSKL